jgi:hypothetical protein
MSVSLLFAKIRSIVQRQQESSGMRRQEPCGQGFRAFAVLNGRCIADVSMGYGQDDIYKPERRSALLRQRQTRTPFFEAEFA